MKKKRKTIEANYCELCGSTLAKRKTIFLKDYHVICSDCWVKYRKKGDKFNLTKMDIQIYKERKAKEELLEEVKKEIEDLEIKAKELKELEKENKEKERLANLEDEIIIDNVLLIGNRRAEMQEALDYCSIGDPVTITWEIIKDKEDGLEYKGEMMIVVHDYSGREIGRLKQNIQKKLVELSQDYTLDGNIEKLGENESGKLYAVITIVAKLKNKT